MTTPVPTSICENMKRRIAAAKADIARKVAMTRRLAARIEKLEPSDPPDRELIAEIRADITEIEDQLADDREGLAIQEIDFDFFCSGR